MNIKAAVAKPAIALAALAAVGGGAGIAALASADTTSSSTSAPTTQNGVTQTQHPHMMGMRGLMHERGAIGTVTAINGNIITLTGDNGTTYTIDASNANVNKMVTESVSDITIGERIGASGTLSGTTITANHIMDGIPAAPQGTQPSRQ